MLTIVTKKSKNGSFENNITMSNASVHEMLSAFDILLDALEQHGVSTLPIIDYVLNREKYTEKRGDK